MEPTPAHLDTSWFNDSLSSSSKDASTIIMLIRLMLHLSVMNTNKVILRHSFGFGYYMSTYLIYFFSWICFVDNYLSRDIKVTNFEFFNYYFFFFYFLLFFLYISKQILVQNKTKRGKKKNICCQMLGFNPTKNYLRNSSINRYQFNQIFQNLLLSVVHQCNGLLTCNLETVQWKRAFKLQ